MFYWGARRTCGLVANNAFNNTFEVVLADTPELQKECFALRYQIFCVERKFDMPHKDGLETDEYDHHSIHFLIKFKPNGLFIGTGRLILPYHGNAARVLPLLKKLDRAHALSHGLAPHVTNVCEISRLGILKAYCRKFKLREKSKKFSLSARLLMPKLADIGKLGLYRGIFECAQKVGIDQCVFCTDDILIRRFAQIGFSRYTVLDDTLDIFGPVTAIKFSISEMLGSGYKEAPENWTIATNNGGLAKTRPLKKPRNLPGRAETLPAHPTKSVHQKMPPQPHILSGVHHS